MTPELNLHGDCYRRRIDVSVVDVATTRCVLQDDFHHFVVDVHHDGKFVLRVTVDSVRFPWSTCPNADTALQALAGMPLTTRFTAASRYANAHANCTHQFDAAAHAITHTAATLAGARNRDRRYDVEIGAHIASLANNPGPNRLWVDGEADLVWTLDGRLALHDAQPPFDAAPWKGGFMRWADATLEADAAERAIVLRRACDIGLGRGMDLDAIPTADELLDRMAGVCYTMQPEIAVGSRRNLGAIRDFSSDPTLLDS